MAINGTAWNPVSKTHLAYGLLSSSGKAISQVILDKLVASCRAVGFGRLMLRPVS
jgi:hypothetical protein